MVVGLIEIKNTKKILMSKTELLFYFPKTCSVNYTNSLFNTASLRNSRSASWAIHLAEAEPVVPMIKQVAKLICCVGQVHAP